MTNISPDRFKKSQASKLRPGQDIITVNKEAKQFPGIGMTLSSYQKASESEKPLSLKPTKVPIRKRFFSKKVFKRVTLTVLGLIIIGGLFFGGKYLYDLKKAFGGSIFDLLHTSKLKGEDVGRVNILLAGDSPDDPQHNGAYLTDSIMLLSINTKNNTAWMLSIPRDLWVNIPNHGYNKINAVYEFGQNDNFSENGYPNGGMGELEKIVSQKLAIPIDYYALINYTAFKQSVDAVGGVSINIQSPDPRGLFDAYTHLKLPNGNVTLNGQQALDLARARGDNAAGDISYGFPQSDFDRTMHQRQLLLALKTKVNTTGVLANPLKLSGLFDALGNNVKTDFKLSDARRLYQLSKVIPTNKIASLSFNNAAGTSLLQSYYTSSGQDALIPAAGVNNYSDIQAFVARYTSNNPIVQEGATVAILNGTYVTGLAATYKDKLSAEHIDVNRTGNTYNTLTTEIIDNSQGKMPKTRAALTSLFGNNVTTTNPYSAYPDSFIIILGSSQL